jgi:predicted DNA-binding transcriptional regulator AlpA
MARRRDRDDDLQPKLVSVAKAEGILGVGRSTIEKLIAQKKLKTVDDVGAKRVVRQSIDDYIANSQGSFHHDQSKMQDDDRVLTFRELKTNYNWSYTPTHTRRLILAGNFPKPFKTGGVGHNLWLKSIVDRYFSERAQSRKKKSKP